MDSIHGLQKDLIGVDASQLKSKLKAVNRKPYFNLGRDTKEVDEYTEGESDSEFPVSIKALKRSRRTQRLVFLWKKAIGRSIVSARLLQATYATHKQLIKEGTIKNLFGSKQHIAELRQMQEK